MGQIALPTREECYAFWDHYTTPQHIRRHMQQVNRVAVYLANRLKENGLPVILDLVDRASLLHDTLRVTEWETLSFEYFPEKPIPEEIRIWEEQRIRYPQHLSHSQVTASLFRDRFPELAQVIAMHGIRETSQTRTWEEKIVNYADRRVAHDRIVTVQERLDEAYERYSKNSDRALERQSDIVAAVYALQDELFRAIGEDPDQLLQHLHAHETDSTTKISGSTTADAARRPGG